MEIARLETFLWIFGISLDNFLIANSQMFIEIISFPNFKASSNSLRNSNSLLEFPYGQYLTIASTHEFANSLWIL
ncbi:unnamed protein product [Blepharisma stoltei]|uniref:Uncharacterized protein n=1 Tax=Blepharisma stoltei TaxID=1481888 RepID=A0AAU9IQI0_9CILI|nr:unnamed protein product [Blepharisma stoltei]